MDSTSLMNQWKRLPIIPENCGRGRYKHTMVTYQEAIYMYGGYEDNVGMLSDLLRFDIKKQSWSAVATTGTSPGRRYNHSAVIYKSSMFIFGGSDSSYDNISNALFEFQFKTKQWHQWSSKNCPAGRRNPCAVVFDHQLWIFGGCGSYSCYLNDMWKLPLVDKNRSWDRVEQKGDCPPAGSEFAVTIVRNYMFALTKNQLFRFNFKQRTWSRTKITAAGSDHVLATFEDQLLILVGSQLNTLYSFDVNTEILSVIKPTTNFDVPNSREFYAACVADGYLFISGGTKSKTYQRELFKFQLAPSYPKCTLSEDFEKLLDKELLPDMELVVGKLRFPTHIAIVAARSHWFADRIRQVRDAQDKHEELCATDVAVQNLPLLEVSFRDYNLDIFEIVIDFIYTDQIYRCFNNVSIILDVYKLAEEIKLKSLQQLIDQQITEEFLNKSVSVVNVLDVISKAHNLNFLRVKEFCLNFITNDSNCKRLLMSKDIEILDNKLLVEIVRRKLNFIQAAVIPQNETPDLKRQTLEADIQEFMETTGNEFSDITLLLGEYEIPAHKSILAARCSYFEAMFRSFMPADKTVRIQISEIVPSKEAFDSLIKYIYYGDINIPLAHSSQLIAAPSFYGFTNNRLIEVFKHKLIRFGTLENMVQILEAADLAQELNMKKCALQLIAIHSGNLKNWPEKFPLPPSLLLDVLNAIIATNNEKST